MTQGVLPFKYEQEKTSNGLTALAGLPMYLDLARVVGLSKSIEKHLHIRTSSQGWSDNQIIISLLLLNLAGGDCVDDLQQLESDEGFCKIVRQCETFGLRRSARRALEKRRCKDKNRSLPSASSVFRYLSNFHDDAQETLRFSSEKKAFIPAPNEYLQALGKINNDMCSGLNTVNFQKTATLDMDATLVPTSKKDSFYCYKGFQAYQPLNVWWHEHGLVLHSEFRDGNVPAGFEQLRVLKEALNGLPENVEKVRLRSDTAGYQHDLLRYCESGANQRFGRIEFAIGCNVTKAFKMAVAQVPETEWKPMYIEKGGGLVETKTQWAEVCYVITRKSEIDFFCFLSFKNASVFSSV